MNYVLYSVLSFGALAALFFLSISSLKGVVFTALYFAITSSFYMLFYISNSLIENINKKNIAKAVVFFIIKNIIIFAGFYIGFLYVGKQIAWGLLIYFIQFFIFGTALKLKSDREQLV